MTLQNIKARCEWILKYINENISVNTLDTDFVDSYIDFGQPKEIKVRGVLARQCPMLNNDLRAMLRDGTIERYTSGVGYLGINSGLGSPKWIYVYQARKSIYDNLAQTN
jgi:hypothetical protein